MTQIGWLSMAWVWFCLQTWATNSWISGPIGGAPPLRKASGSLRSWLAATEAWHRNWRKKRCQGLPWAAWQRSKAKWGSKQCKLRFNMILTKVNGNLTEKIGFSLSNPTIIIHNSYFNRQVVLKWCFRHIFDPHWCFLDPFPTWDPAGMFVLWCSMFKFGKVHETLQEMDLTLTETHVSCILVPQNSIKIPQYYTLDSVLMVAMMLQIGDFDTCL